MLWLILPAVLTTGCSELPYVLQVAEGQLAIQRNVEPIADVLASGRLSAEDEAKLRLIVEARDYAADTMGLNAGESYTTFYDTEGQPLAYNLSAARRDALVAKTWTFPVMGEVPYLAFFDKGDMDQVEQQLIAEGYDTMTYELDAYSTLGMFEDPVRSPMLRRGSLSLIETVIHELLHNTVWRPNDTVFNESLATFVGRQGAVEFLRAKYGDDSGWPQLAINLYADADAVTAFVMQLYADLEDLYGEPIDSAEKIAERDAVYQAARDRFTSQVLPTLHYPDSFAGYADLPTNNAWVLANYRYNLDLTLLANVYAANGDDWPATLDVFRSAASAADDPFAYLRDWLTSR